jgi:HAD superfamily phosphatase (TIGR01668 family)
MLRILTPHFRVRRVWELTPERLDQWGLCGLLLDVDCTLARYHREAPLPEAAVWLEQIRRAGIGICLISNGLGGRIRKFAEQLCLPCVSRAMKPLPWGVRKAAKMIHFPPAQTAMVGDQIFADVMAGRLAGIRTILVEPIHPEEEHWFTRLKRPAERVILSRLT